MFVANEGKIMGTIGIDSICSEAVRFAAGEFQKYVEKMTGALMPICTEERSDIIVKVMLDARCGLEDEEFSITCDGKCLNIKGGGDAGTVYGVYHFLKEYCGIVFAGFKAEGEYVPEMKSIEVDDINERRKPLLWYRGSQLTLVGEIDQDEIPSWKEMAVKRIDWMAKNGMNYIMYMPAYKGSYNVLYDFKWKNETEFETIAKKIPLWYTHKWFREQLLPEIKKRGLKVEQAHHNFQFYLPPEDYFGKHPEYFALVNGKRMPGSSQLMICTSNKEAVEELVRNMISFAEENPEMDILGLMPEDGLGLCECEECRKLDSPEYQLVMEGRTSYGENQNKVRRYVRILNYAAREVKKRFPGKKVSALFYVDMAWPPKDMELEDNIVPVVCMYVRCGAHDYNDPGCSNNVDFYNLAKAWSAFGNKNVILYEYYMAVSAYKSLPYPIARRIADDWKLLAPMGIGGATMQSSITVNEMYGFNNYAFARRGWDLEVSFDKIFDDYMKGMYGSKGSRVKPVYAMLMDAMDEYGRSGKCFKTAPNDFFKVVSREDIDWAEGVIDGISGEQCTICEKVQLDRLKLVIEFLRLVMNVNRSFADLYINNRTVTKSSYDKLTELLKFEEKYKDVGFFAFGNDKYQWKYVIREFKEACRWGAFS